MEEKNVTKINLSTFFLILAIIAIIVMGIFIYKLNNDKTAEIQKSTALQAQVNNLNGTVSSLQGKINTTSDTVSSQDTANINNTDNNTIDKSQKETSIESQKNSNQDNFDELYTIIKIDTNSRDYDQHKANNDNNVLYDFKSKKWSNSLFESYYLAVDSSKNLYIVDAAENIISKLNVKLEKLANHSYVNANGQEINYQIDNYITYARVSKLQNILEIQTGDDFITYLVNLQDFSTKLAEINDY